MTLMNILFVGLLAIIFLAVVKTQQAYTWRKLAHEYEKKWKDICEMRGHLDRQVKDLEVKNVHSRSEAKTWEDSWNFTADYLNKGGAVLALTTVSAQSNYQAATEEQIGLHLGSAENIFLPIPISRPRVHQATNEQEPVVVLTNKPCDTSGSSFHIVVLRLQDAIAKETLKQLCSPVFVAKIHINILEENIVNDGKRYKLDIEPVSGKSRGANSLAMDWLLRRAKEEGVKEIFGTLTNSIISESHRIRLYNFYVKKYGFVYAPENNIITRIIG